MSKNKRMLMAIILFMLTIVIVGIYIYSIQQKEKAERAEQEKRRLYYRQNEAFGLSYGRLNEGYFFHGREELDLPRVALSIYVYNCDQSNYELTIDKVEEYLSEEYAEDGSLRIYSCPADIIDYIDWYYHCGGNEAISYFEGKVSDYMENNGYECDYTDLSIEELQMIMPMVEYDWDYWENYSLFWRNGRPH